MWLLGSNKKAKYIFVGLEDVSVIRTRRLGQVWKKVTGLSLLKFLSIKILFLEKILALSW